MQNREHLFVGGAWIRPGIGKTIEVVSPHTECVVAQVAAAGPVDVDLAVRSARAAFDRGPWPRLDILDRVDVVRRLETLYDKRRPDMADLITTEMGAPTTFANRAQVSLPWMTMKALIDAAADFSWQEVRPGHYGQDIVIRREPVGVVAIIVPWNMPQFLTVIKLIPALLAGCTIVLKPSPEAPLDALLLADMLEEVGLPPGVVSVLPGGRDVGEHLVAHPDIDKVSFTGSTAAGRQVAAACASGLTRTSLELGGKSAAIVLDDADPETVAAGIRSASLSNSGQICNALTRILVPANRSRDYVDALSTVMSSMRIGDPADPSTEVGPLVTRRQQTRVRNYIELGQREGARLIVGGTERPSHINRGWYVCPTLFADADNGMRIAREEIFGPVLTVISYRDVDDAVTIANDSEYGLAGSVWTSDIDLGLTIAARVRTGTFGVNQGYTMDPAAPFGGMKSSGYGRELGHEGFAGFVDTKSISIGKP